MKKLRFILVLLLTLMISGCGDNKDTKDMSNDVENYDIVKETYINKNIKINYPQIGNLSDSVKQKKVNELIKNEAIKVQENYKDDMNNLDLNMDYEIKYKGSDMLSIEYLGLVMIKGAAYPINEINTTNINLEKEQPLTLRAVATINDEFIKKFNAGKYIAYSLDLNLESAGALNDALNSFSSNELIESLKQQTAKFYFTKDSLVVSVEVIHVMGDHLEMEIKYNDLGDLLLINPAS